MRFPVTADGEGRCFLATYRPLVRTASGRQAIQEHDLLPFIDGSCRREPDFESPFPSITATCRGRNFAPRLRIGDRVAYLTVRGRYLCDRQSGWRLVAVLRVVQRFASHTEAAAWYQRQGRPLPSNCIVEGNPPKPLELTNGDPPKEVKERGEHDPEVWRRARYHEIIEELSPYKNNWDIIGKRLSKIAGGRTEARK